MMKRSPEFYLAQRVQRIQVSAIKQMPVLAQGQSEVVSLGQGIPSMPTPAPIRAAVIEALQNDDAITKYSLQPGLPALKIAVATQLEQRYGCQVNAQRELFISAGGMEALATAISSIVNPGDEVIVFDPGYASHLEQILFADGVPVSVPLQSDQGWQINESALRAAFTPKTKAIIVCNPSNPTGTVFTKTELDLIVELAEANDVLIIADETYAYLVYDDQPFVSLLSYPKIRERLLYCYSFSKEYAMTGWRVGYLYAPAWLIEQALKVHDAFVICAPTVSQYAALAALRSDSSEQVAMKEIFQARRDLMCERLDALSDLFTYVRPQGAYYVLARYTLPNMTAWDLTLKLLREARVITIPGSAFGPSGEHHIRLSFCGTDAVLNEAFDRITQWYQTQSL